MNKQTKEKIAIFYENNINNNEIIKNIPLNIFYGDIRNMCIFLSIGYKVFHEKILNLLIFKKIIENPSILSQLSSQIAQKVKSEPDYLQYLKVYQDD